MSPTPQIKRNFHELVKQTFDKPLVRLLVDLSYVSTSDMVSLFGSEAGLLSVVTGYSRSFGNLVDVKIFTDATAGQLETFEPSSIDAETVMYLQRWQASRCIYVLVSPDELYYNHIAELLATAGNLVIILGMESKESTSTYRHDLVFYTPISRLAPEHTTQVNPESYDFEGFIQLLATSERLMPFVGVGYFIREVMRRLGIADPVQRQNLFQLAKERGIVELLKSDNIDAHSPPVSACKLNRSHELVKKVLAQEESSETQEEFSNRMDLSGVEVEERSGQ